MKQAAMLWAAYGEARVLQPTSSKKLNQNEPNLNPS